MFCAHWIRATVLAVAAYGIGHALAQAPPAFEPREAATAATLPESNEAMLLASRVEDAIQRADYRLAIRLIEQLLQSPGELVAAPGSRTYYPVWRQAVRLLAGLPEEGVEQYRRLNDAEVAARLEAAERTGDLAALTELFRIYRPSSHWPAIGRELVAQLLDRGHFGEALEALRELSSAESDANPDTAAQLVVALTRVGAWRAAGAALQSLEQRAELGARAERVKGLRRWFDAQRSGADPPAVGEPPAELSPQMTADAEWSASLAAPLDDAYVDDDGNLANAIDYSRRMPLHRATLANETLLLRVRGAVLAFDELTLTPRWHVREIDGGAAGVGGLPWRISGRSAGGGENGALFSDDAQLLLGHPLRHALATAFGLVLTVESLALDSAEFEAAAQRRLWEMGQVLSPNQLVAREVQSGALAWRLGADATDPLFGVAFQDAPVRLGSALVVPIQRGEELHLCALEPTTGKVLREVPIVGPPTYFTAVGGRSLIVSDETTVYVSTGNGVVAALDGVNLEWKWATVYPSLLGEHLGAVWWQGEVRPREAGFDPLVLADDLLILAPVDSLELIALDRFNGRERWRVPRGEHAVLVGAAGDGLILAGTALTCVDLSDGRTIRWRSAPLAVTGRPIVCGSRVFVPTQLGLTVVDVRTGKIVEDQWRGGTMPTAAANGTRPSGLAPAPASLLSTPTGVVAFSPNTLMKFPDLAATRARCSALLAVSERGESAPAARRGPAPDDRARLALAWLDVLEHKFPSALQTLSLITSPDSGVAAARDRLLTDVFIGLAGQSQAEEDRLRWLRNAAGLAQGPDASTELLLLLGRTLEETQRWSEAVEHYRDVIAADSPGFVRSNADPELRVAGWLVAGERIRRALEELSPAEAEPLVAGLISSAARWEKSPVLLERLRGVLSGRPEAVRIAAEILARRPAPELIAPILPPRDAPEIPPELARAVHLNRWETNAALGRIEEAEADEEFWQARFAEQPQRGDSADAEARQTQGIRTAIAKLRATQTEPFSEKPRYQWKLQDAELIVDERAVASASPWILLRDLRNRQVLLYCTLRNTQLRETRDALLAGAGAQAAELEAAEQVFGRRGSWETPVRSAWPATVYGDLAVVPVTRGLVCVGLGPERQGGRRLWEYPLPDAIEIDATFCDRAVGGSAGLFFSPRPDRVVLLGWSDGRVHWQRNLPGLRVRQLALSGDVLVIIGEDQQVVVVDAASGRNPRRLPAQYATPRALEVMDETIVAWADEWIAGFEAASLERRWSRPCAGVDDRARVPERGWLAYRERTSADWRLIDAASGQDICKPGLGALGDVTAMHAEGSRLLVAAIERPATEREAPRSMRLAALELPEGRVAWSRSLNTYVSINAGQLAAHPELIPVLMMDNGGGQDDAPDPKTLALQLLDKRTGQIREMEPIWKNHFERRDASCGAMLLATPSRIIVQAAGNVVAFGNSPLGRVP